MQNVHFFILKEQCHEIFCFRFFSWIIFAQAPGNNIGSVFENSRRYSQVKLHGTGINDTGSKFATGVNYACAHWAANISANFHKNLKRPLWDTQGPGGNRFMNKTWSRKSRSIFPLKGLFRKLVRYGRKALRSAFIREQFRYIKFLVSVHHVGVLYVQFVHSYLKKIYNSWGDNGRSVPRAV